MTAKKEIYNDGKYEWDMEIDASSYEELSATKFHEDESKLLPYSLCGKDEYRILAKLDEDCFCYIPSKALLALFKIKASRDRHYDLEKRGQTMDRARRAWLESKVTKDRTDIIALLDPAPRDPLVKAIIDTAQIREIASKYGIQSIVRESLQNLARDRASVRAYSPDLAESAAKSWIGDLGLET